MKDFLRKKREELGYSVTQVAEKLDVARTTIYKWEDGRIESIGQKHIEKLIELYHVTPMWFFSEGEHSSVAEYEAVSKGFTPIVEVNNSIPLIGDIACGSPILANENVQDYLPALPNISADFALTCHGDSMIGAGLFDGDIVYIKSCVFPQNGAITAVRIGDEVTIKRVEFQDDTLTLIPSNPAYKNIIYKGAQLANVHIIGKVVSSIRRF